MDIRSKYKSNYMRGEEVRESKRTVRKSGNSLVIGITPGAIEILKLKEGDLVEQKVQGNKIIITKVKGDL